MKTPQLLISTSIGGIQVHNTKIAEVKDLHRISDVIKQYMEMKRSKKSWRPKSEVPVKATFRIFSELMGDIYFEQIGDDEMKRYQDCISRLPKNLNCESKFKGKRVTEILEMKDVNIISRTTMNGHIDRVKALFDWAQKKNYTDRNYAEDLRFVDKKRRVRVVFHREDLQKIISGDEYTQVKGKRHKKHAFFWAPIIGMFTGARLEEICQLRVADIRQDEGIWYFAFNSEEGEGKTEAAVRNVPVHSMLIKLGFIRFVNWQKRNNHKRLFNELDKHTRNGYGAQVSKWFNRNYLVSCGVKDPIKDSNRKVFHSYRHTVVFSIFSRRMLMKNGLN